MGSGQSFSGIWEGQRVWVLSGFSKSEAIFARTRLEDMPTLTVKPKRSFTEARMKAAPSSGEEYLWAIPVKSRKHSSILTCSRSGVRVFRKSINSLLLAA